MQNPHEHDVLIIGGGISGAALLYLLARYTNIKRLGLLEKYSTLASVNTHGSNNSQTLHCGDIETNYTIEKARQVKTAANMVVKYAAQLSSRDQLLFKYPKMVLGVGDQECAYLRERFVQFSPFYPGMQLLDARGISQLEPAVTRGRKEEVYALATVDEYSAVNFQALAQSFVQQAQATPAKQIEIALSARVSEIKQTAEGFSVQTPQATHRAKFVVVSAGGHSLLFAQKMGYGLQYSCLPMAGSFYFAPKLLNGKVYTVQNDKLPFAAIHGDPDLLVPGKTRFGPTALALPLLERYHWSTFPEFLQVFKPDRDVIKTLWGLVKVPEIRNYMLKNVLFEIPLIRRRLFLRDVRKIVPTIQLSDLTFARKTGGIRPVMIDKQQHKLHLGEAKINPGSGVIFNMTPSPGATSCLGNAEQDLRIIVDYLAASFAEDEFTADLK